MGKTYNNECRVIGEHNYHRRHIAVAVKSERDELDPVTNSNSPPAGQRGKMLMKEERRGQRAEADTERARSVVDVAGAFGSPGASAGRSEEGGSTAPPK